MKRKRNLLVVLLLVCAIGLGVGYAEINANLTITNNVKIDPQAFDVKFVNYEVTTTNPNQGNQTENAIEVAITGDVTAKSTAATGTLNDQTVTIDVTNLRDEGEIVTVEFTIQNKNDATMYLDEITNSNPTLNGLGQVTISDPSATTLVENATATVTVTIKLENSCDAQTTVNNIEITIPATSTNPNP